MLLNRIRIGNLVAPNNLFLAPLAGYTNAVFRAMCEELGAGLTFTEMVSAKGLCYDSRGSRELLRLTDRERTVNACQIFGNDPYYMEKAACGEELAPFDLIDINMGCPVPKIYKNGEGSALLGDIPLAQSLVRAVKKSGKAVSVKFRVGLDGDRLIAAEFAKAMEDAGADLLTVHGRTRDKIYSGEVNYAQIAAAKNAVRVPVVANGGVFTPSDADKLLAETGADGVMIARGAMYDPFLFAAIAGKPVPDKKAVVVRQLEETYALYGERFATVYMRKMIAFYLKGQPNAASLRVKLLSCNDKEEIAEVLGSVTL